jgi:carbonic anhydrase
LLWFFYFRLVLLFHERLTMKNPYAIEGNAREGSEPASVVRWILEHNRKQSELFLSPDAFRNRVSHRRKHPTLLGALKCMDGRLHLPTMTNTPLGIIQPFRNIGGKFDIGWPYLQSVLHEFLEYAYTNGKKDCILFVTYHYSKGDVHRGCKGFNYDTEAARRSAEELRLRIARICKDITEIQVGVIMLGIETDDDALILHGEDGSEVNLSEELSTPEPVMLSKVITLFPSLSEWMIEDLMPLVVGNLAHIKEVRQSDRSIIEFDHCECCVGVGRGFDWLHAPNRALLVGAYSFDVGDPIVKAAGIVLDNLRSGRVKAEGGVLLMASALYWENSGLGIHKRLAIEKAMTLAEYSLQKIRADKNVRPLLEHLSVVVGEVDMRTRQFQDRTEKFWQNRNVFG